MTKPPREATSTALAAIDAALKLGHRPRVDFWRKLTGRMWATVCSECGREVWLIGPAGGWTYGGSAIRESCQLAALDEAEEEQQQAGRAPQSQNRWYVPRGPRSRGIGIGTGAAARPGPSARLSGSIGVMGYQIVTNTDGESLSDEVWMDLITLASKHGFSAPRLSHLGQYADTNLTEAEDSGLYAALERALFAGEPQEHITPEHDVLDRDTVRRVSHVLRGPGIKMLRRTPPCGAKQLPFAPVLGHPRASDDKRGAAFGRGHPCAGAGTKRGRRAPHRTCSDLKRGRKKK